MTTLFNHNNEENQALLQMTPDELEEISEEIDELERLDAGLMKPEEGRRFLKELYANERKRQAVYDMLNHGFLHLSEEDRRFLAKLYQDEEKTPTTPEVNDPRLPHRPATTPVSALRPRGTMNPRVKKWVPTVVVAACLLCIFGGFAVFFKNPVAVLISKPLAFDPNDTWVTPNAPSTSSDSAPTYLVGPLGSQTDPTKKSSQVENVPTLIPSLAAIRARDEQRKTDQEVAKEDANNLQKYIKKYFQVDNEGLFGFDRSGEERKIGIILELLYSGGFKEARYAWDSSLQGKEKMSFDEKTCEGILLYFEGKLDEAERALDEACQMNQNSTVASENLEIVRDAIEKSKKTNESEH